MTLPGGAAFVTKIKAAITAGIRPCAMVFYQSPQEDWTAWDFKLMEAYQILQDETCPQCGKPIWICDSDDGNLYFSVRTRICYASRELEQTRAKREKAKKELGKGEYEYVVTERANPEIPLPTRQQYYENLAKNPS